MKAKQLIHLLQSQVELYGDLDVEVTNLLDCNTEIKAVTTSIYGTIQIIIK